MMIPAIHQTVLPPAVVVGGCDLRSSTWSSVGEGRIEGGWAAAAAVAPAGSAPGFKPRAPAIPESNPVSAAMGAL